MQKLNITFYEFIHNKRSRGNSQLDKNIIKKKDLR